MQRFLRSSRHALAGLAYAAREERNFIIELVCAAAVIVLALWFPLTSEQRAILVLACGIVLSLELVNTAFERMLDMIKPRVHPYVRVIKDLVAGAVLVSAATGIIIGLLIFLPYVW